MRAARGSAAESEGKAPYERAGAAKNRIEQGATAMKSAADTKAMDRCGALAGLCLLATATMALAQEMPAPSDPGSGMPADSSTAPANSDAATAGASTETTGADPTAPAPGTAPAADTPPPAASVATESTTAATPVDTAAAPVAASVDDPGALEGVPARENSPLYRGSYLAPMGTFLHQFGTKGQTGNGYGGTFVAGYRQGFFSMEGRGTFTSISISGGDPGRSNSAQFRGFSIDGLLFPFYKSDNRFLQNAYGIVGVGAFEARKYPTNTNSFDAASFDGGVGDFIPVKIGRYEFGIRAEALYRYGDRTQRLSSKQDIDAPLHFSQTIFNVGVQLPLVFKHETQAPPPQPVTVVPVADADGDGVLDPVDQCPDTPKGTAVDAKGCPLPKPRCNVPLPGENLTEQGCGAGGVIVLDGVNFDFNQARLTPNARTILDNIAPELQARTDVHFEIGGYTDSRGSDSYNQKLSEARARAVLDYLQQRGMAAERMTATGYGESNPVDSNESDAGRERNRRVELKLSTSADATPTP